MAHVGRTVAVRGAIERFVARNRREPLSPLWEAFIDGDWRPRCQDYLDQRREDDRMQDPFPLTTMQREVTYHAFNLSNAEVNAVRVNQFVSLLAIFERPHNVATRAEALLPWWPQNGVDMLEAIKREREEMDSLGHIQSAASRPGEESLPIQRAGRVEPARAQEGETSATCKRKRSASTSSNTS